MIKLAKITRNRKRVGRGISAGQGKTAGRGTKGQNSRTGKKRHSGFTTGASPLQMKLPKVDGNKVIKPYFTITTDLIGKYFQEKDQITIPSLQEKGLLPKRLPKNSVVKVVLGTQPTKPLLLENAIAHSKNVAVVSSETA